MKPRNQNFKFNKKTPKTTKIIENKKEKYSKIINEVFSNKEESKNNNIYGSSKSIKIFNIKNTASNNQQTSKYIKNIKIKLNYNKKNSKNNIKEEPSIYGLKEKKYLNQKKVGVFQSNSEKNLSKDILSEDLKKKNNYINKNVNNSNTNVICLNKNIKININLNSNSSNDNYLLRNQRSFNNKRELEKYPEKKILDKIKFIEENKEKINNLPSSINEIFGNKKSTEQIKHFYQNNNIQEFKANNLIMNKTLLKNLKKGKNSNINLNNNNNNSPEKIIIKINNVGTHNSLNNKNIQKKIHKNNTGINSNDIESKKLKILNLKNKKKQIIYNNTENSSSNQSHKLKKHLKKNNLSNISKDNNNSNKKCSNSKINYSSTQLLNIKGVKVESINIDLNNINPKKNSFYHSHKITETDYPNIIDKNSLTLRESDSKYLLSKYNKINKHLELSLVGNNESYDLNYSFKTSFSLSKKTRSLSRKRDEKKKLYNKFKDINNNEIEKKFNEILRNLSSIKENIFQNNLNRKNQIKSEPKKYIDKIRKARKLKKL